MKRFLKKLARLRAAQPVDHTVRPEIEPLESRVVPYATTSNAWPNPQLITISFVPDGTIIGSTTSGYIYSNLFATLNAKFGSAAKWEAQILKAAQLWAQQTNLNFAVVPDSGAPLGSGNDQQGDPTMGDIRISGYNFGNNSELAVACLPPPINNYSIAGDITLNTGQTFNIGSSYDLETVVAHEFGHALGLSHSNTPTAEMYATYTAMKQTLSSDDDAGIRTIYTSGSARSYDVYGGTNTGFSTAANLTAQINASSQTALVSGLNIATAGQKEYFSFTVPSGTNGTFTIDLQSQGLSQLAPTLSIYNSSQGQLATVSGAGQDGTTLSVTVSGVTAGSTYYVQAAGADTTAFGTGTYALTMTFGKTSAPTAAAPNTQVADGTTRSSGGGLAEDSPGGSVSGLLGSVLGGLGGLGGLAGDLVDDAGDLIPLVGDLLGISTSSGLGAAYGDFDTVDPSLLGGSAASGVATVQTQNSSLSASNVALVIASGILSQDTPGHPNNVGGGMPIGGLAPAVHLDLPSVTPTATGASSTVAAEAHSSRPATAQSGREDFSGLTGGGDVNPNGADRPGPAKQDEGAPSPEKPAVPSESPDEARPSPTVELASHDGVAATEAVIAATALPEESVPSLEVVTPYTTDHAVDIAALVTALAFPWGIDSLAEKKKRRQAALAARR